MAALRPGAHPRAVVVAAILLAPLTVLAVDPLKSEACAERLAALEQARRGAQAAGAIEALRERATRACLGGSGEARRPSPEARAPIVVAPPVIEAEPAQPVPARGADPPPPGRPPVVTACDLGGCWDSQGNRLNRAGDLLIGPRGGVCTTVGSTVHCP